MNILIIGGTGSVGHIIADHLYHKHDISIFSRNENLQWKMRQKYPDCQYVVGDIRDADRVKDVVEDQDIVIHLAALKHVLICDENRGEAYKTNVIGTENVINAIGHNVKKALYFNTDKAIRPISYYGQTKEIASNLWHHKNDKRFYEFICGNVINSSGSVLQIYKEFCARGEECLPVSHPEVERYFITANQIREMIDYFLTHDDKNVIMTNPIRIRIEDMVHALGKKAKYHGLGKDEKIKEDYPCEVRFATYDEIREVIKEAWA